MPFALVKRAVELARDREALVRAMALLHAARVLAAMDIEAARQVFGEGVAAADGLNLPAHETEYVLHEAVRLGAYADPLAAVALFRKLPPGGHGWSRRMAGTTLVRSLAWSGDFENALGLLEDLHYEMGGAQAVVDWAPDPAVQRRAMAAARERWRALRKSVDPHQGHRAENDFFRLFSRHWRKLEAAEQEIWLDEILHALETDPDRPTNASFGHDVKLHSTRDSHLFEILSVLRALKPADQVEAILRERPDVAEGARIYPLGIESLFAERRPAPQAPEGGPGGWGFGSSGSLSANRLLAATMAARQGDPSGVRDLLAETHRLYREDTDASDPNVAPLVFWPSCHAYRSALYWAGDRSGQAAEPLLAEIPDADLALLASIELAAGTLGLPEHSGVRMENHPRRRRQG